MDKKDKALSGANNKRLNSYRPYKKEEHAAWADIDKLKPHSKVGIPSMEGVVNAKEWVDNGSKL